MRGWTSRFLSLVTLACSLACMSAAAVDLLRQFPNWFGDWMNFFLVHVYVILFSLLLGFSVLVKSQWVAQHFGFLRACAGSGVFLMLIGSLTYAYADWWGRVGGIASMLWGGALCIVH